MTLLDEFRVYLARPEHWSAPQRIRETAMTMPALAYTVKGKDERIGHLRRARDRALKAGLRTTCPPLQKTCTVAAKELSRTIGRVLVMSDLNEIRAELEKLPKLLAVKSLALVTRTFPAEAAEAGIADGIEWDLAFAASDT